jgi:hypothetical protein
MNIFLLVFIFLYPTLMAANVFFSWLNVAIFLIQLILTVWIIYRWIITLKSKSRKIYFSQLYKKIHFFIILLLIINIVSLTRGYFNGFINENGLISNITSLILFYFVGLVASVGSENEVIKEDQVFSALYLGIVFYVLMNFFTLYVLNIQSPIVMASPSLQQNQLGEGIISSFLGLGFKRTIFPLAGSFGVTHLASIVGIVLVESSIKIMYSKEADKLSMSKFNLLCNYISAIVCFLMLLLLDSRAPFFSSILVLAFFFIINLRKSWFRTIVSYTPLILIANYLFPFIYKIISDFLQPLFQDYGLNRNVSTSSFSDREVIWDSVLKFFSIFDPEQIIGYGMWGQYQAGLNADYEGILFSNYFNKETSLFTLHSTSFQRLIDVGYLGIFIYTVLTLLSIISLLTLIKVSRRKYGFDDVYAISSLGVFIYLEIIGNFDPVVTQERMFTTNIYLLLVISSLRRIKPTDSTFMKYKEK